jgi:hypothetical protein
MRKVFLMSMLIPLLALKASAEDVDGTYTSVMTDETPAYDRCFTNPERVDCAKPWLVKPYGIDYGLNWKPSTLAKARSAHVSKGSHDAAERIERLRTLLQQFKQMKREVEQYWAKEMALNKRLRESNEGLWAMHAQEEAIEKRCTEIEFKIQELEVKPQIDGENVQ